MAIARTYTGEYSLLESDDSASDDDVSDHELGGQVEEEPEDGVEQEDEAARAMVVGPYMHEPDAADDPEYVPADRPDLEWRLDGGMQRLSEWCKCKNCQPMATAAECCCCLEIENVDAKREVGELQYEKPLSCITDHPSFAAVCLNPDVLEIAWLNFRSQYKGKAFEGPSDAKYRHIAYRQVVRWCWTFLGRDNRVVLPACVVSCIRAHFPPPGNEDSFLFKGFQVAEEHVAELD